MTESCSPGIFSDAGAVYHHGTLVIWARGDKPTPCHTVRIKRLPIKIFPAEYGLDFCAGSGFCLEVITPYSVAEPFLTGAQDTVRIHTRDGVKELKVQMTDDPKLSLGPTAGGTAMTMSLVPSSNDTANNTAARREATGYSEAFDFGEAFRDAVRNLPPDQNNFPDKLSTVSVTSIGGVYGGFAGIAKMYVKVTTDG